MRPIRLGDVEITRVVEIPRSTYPTSDMLPTSRAEVIARHRAGWLGAFYDASTGDLGSRIQSYVVRTPDETVLIDACVGNDKKRENALWNMRRGTWLDDLRAAGVAPEDVDYVLCTHMHVDHVGWNTQRVDGRTIDGHGPSRIWVPTFPRAAYVFVGEEWEFWKHESETGKDHDGCIDDSVIPIVEAGRAAGRVHGGDRHTPPLRADAGPHAGPRERATHDERGPGRVLRGPHASRRAGGGTRLVEPLLQRRERGCEDAPCVRGTACRQRRVDLRGAFPRAGLHREDAR
jgi:hypothetical protein